MDILNGFGFHLSLDPVFAPIISALNVYNFRTISFLFCVFPVMFRGEVVFVGGRLQGIKGSLCWHCLTRTLAPGGVGKAARKSVTGLAQLLPKPRSASVVK